MSYTERTESRGMLVTGHSQIKPNNLTTLEVHWLVWNIGKTSNSNRWSSVSFSFTIQILRWYTQFSDTHTHMLDHVAMPLLPWQHLPQFLPPSAASTIPWGSSKTQECNDHQTVWWPKRMCRNIYRKYRPKSSQIQKFWDLSWASLENDN